MNWFADEDNWVSFCVGSTKGGDIDIAIKVTKLDGFLDILRTAFDPSPHFYRTQVNLGSDLWVRMSVRPSLRHLVET